MKWSSRITQTKDEKNSKEEKGILDLKIIFALQI